jgi:hypothetical protein
VVAGIWTKGRRATVAMQWWTTTDERLGWLCWRCGAKAYIVSDTQRLLPIKTIGIRE